MPVIDHEIHPMTQKTGHEPYGCFNRTIKPYYMVKTREYRPDKTYEMVDELVAHTMSTECRNDSSLRDPRCEQCRHRGSGERYAESVREAAR